VDETLKKPVSATSNISSVCNIGLPMDYKCSERPATFKPSQVFRTVSIAEKFLAIASPRRLSEIRQVTLDSSLREISLL
jgi:hypothetical protein